MTFNVILGYMVANYIFFDRRFKNKIFKFFEKKENWTFMMNENKHGLTYLEAAKKIKNTS